MAKKKGLGLSLNEKRQLIDLENPEISITKQCQLLSLAKGSLYYESVKKDTDTLLIMDLLDKQYLKTPFYGSRRMQVCLDLAGYTISRKRVVTLMKAMGIRAIYPKPNLSKRRLEHRIYPYLLRNVKVTKPNFVWSSDITYIRIGNGFLYLMAVIDWYSRYVLTWEFSNSLDAFFCVEGLLNAMNVATPEIFNTDQGAQFTSESFLAPLKEAKIKISMDSKGRALDNVFIERLWRSVKYEEVYLKDYQNIKEAEESISQYFDFYNNERPHQSLNYQTPGSIYL